jgi:hypothetical protein
MKQGFMVVLISALFLLAPSIQAEEEIIIKMPFAFQDKFQEVSQDLGWRKGKVLQLGCLIKPADSPIKEVTIENLSTGAVYTPSQLKVGAIWSGLYIVDPMPPFDPSKHLGVWKIKAIDEKGNQAVAKTHKLDNYGELPYVKNIKATGNHLSPLVTWSALNDKDIPTNIFIHYQVRLLTDMKNQLHKSKQFDNTEYQIPENIIKKEDLSKIYIRVDTLGYDKTDSEHSVPFEVSSRSFMLLLEALSKE